jgi:phosphate starvation-inducible membrane PsiE
MTCGGSHLGFPIGIIGPYEKNVSKRFFSETTRIIDTKLPRNDHWNVLYKVCVFYMYSLALIIFVVSEKKAFEHFPIGFNVNLCITVAAILDFRSA